MTKKDKPNSKLQFALVALLFGAPLLLAVMMYRFGVLLPSHNTNHGTLLQPVVNLEAEAPASVPALPGNDTWRLIYANEGECDDVCQAALLRLRQVRLMLGNEMNRVTRVFLHGPMVPDRVFLDKHHAGLETATDSALSALLVARRPDDQAPGGLYLVDPLHNLVMYFAPDLAPADLVDDIKHLLDLSRIG